VDDQPSRSARLRYTATGAVVALAVAGAIAGAGALAAKPPAAKPPAAKPAAVTPAVAKPPAANHAPAADPRAFLNDVQRLVANGTITAAEGRAVDREIIDGRIDTGTLASSGFTPSQLDAVQHALVNTKRGLALAAHGG
jgi:hypothetical protein